MGVFDIIHFTEASLEQKDDEPSVWACFGFYPKDITYTMFVYDAVMYGEHLSKPQKAIVKLRRFRAGTEQFWQSRLDANIHASGVASVFTEKTGAGKITFVKQYLAPLKGYSRWEKFCRSMKHYDFRDFKKDEMVLIEPLCSDTMTFFKDDIILDAFSHFSYVDGKHQCVIAIFKGRKHGNEYCLVTPKILTSQREINEFFNDHTCNDLCSGWSKPDKSISPKTPLFRLPGETHKSLRLQKQTSMQIQDPGEHTVHVRAPMIATNSWRSSNVERQDSVDSQTAKRKVTTIMHAVYVHEDPKDKEAESLGASAPDRRPSATSVPDKVVKKDTFSKLLRRKSESSSPRIKNKPVNRVNSVVGSNIGMPKMLNVQPSTPLKPALKPKPDLKKNHDLNQKPELKPKPEIKPKPKLKKQENIEHDVEKDFQYGVQKMAVQDELKARLSKININQTKEKEKNENRAPVQETSEPIKDNDVCPIPDVERDKKPPETTDNISNNSRTECDLNSSGVSLPEVHENSVSEKKVKSQKLKKLHAPKQAVPAT